MNANNMPTADAEAKYEDYCNTPQQMVKDAVASTDSTEEAGRYIEQVYAGYPQGYISDAQEILENAQ